MKATEAEHAAELVESATVPVHVGMSWRPWHFAGIAKSLHSDEPDAEVTSHTNEELRLTPSTDTPLSGNALISGIGPENWFESMYLQ